MHSVCVCAYACMLTYVRFAHSDDSSPKGTGTTGIQLAKAFGATGTLITTTSADNFDYCKALGATRAIDYKTVNWWDQGVVDDDSLDVIYDTVGQEGTGDRAMAKLKTGGFYITIAGALASKVKPGTSRRTANLCTF